MASYLTIRSGPRQIVNDQVMPVAEHKYIHSIKFNSINLYIKYLKEESMLFFSPDLSPVLQFLSLVPLFFLALHAKL